MSIVSAIRTQLDQLQSYTALHNGVRVITHCMYPTNDLVSVVVRGNEKSFVISDEGGAVRSASNVGLEIGNVRHAFSSLVKRQGLYVDGDTIYSPSVTIEGVGAAIILVANASKEASEWCFDHFKYSPTRKFRDVVADLIGRQFGNTAQHQFEVVGFSNKMHRFEYAIPANNKISLIDSVTPDAASVNSRIVSNLDVQRLHDKRFAQYVIFDDSAKWASSDLELLTLAAEIIPISKATNLLQKIDLR